MRLRTEVTLGIGGILVVQVLLAFLAIALLARMGPAIEHILEENVYSEEAVEEMLALLADPPEITGDSQVPPAFDHALQRAVENVTEAEERPLLKRIRSGYVAAFEGDRSVRSDVVSALRELGHVNRRSMARADDQAKRLGTAGAWATVLLGTIAFALGIVVSRRLRHRLQEPVERIRATIREARTGNIQIRCPSEGPAELREIADHLNWLLDRRLQEDLADEASGEADSQRYGDALRALLDARSAPTAIFATDGRCVAASSSALEHVSNTEIDDDRWDLTAIEDTNWAVATWTA